MNSCTSTELSACWPPLTMFIIGSRQDPGAAAAQIAIQRQPDVIGGGVGHGQGDAQHRVGAQVLFVFRTVELDHAVVDGRLIEGIEADDFVGDLFVDVIDRLEHPLALEELLLFGISQFPSFVHAGAGAAGDRGPAKRAVGQGHVDLNGRIAAAVENLSGVNVNNRTHRQILALVGNESVAVGRESANCAAIEPDWLRVSQNSRFRPQARVVAKPADGAARFKAGAGRSGGVSPSDWATPFAPIF